MEARRSDIRGLVTGSVAIAVFMGLLILLVLAVAAPAQEKEEAKEAAHSYIGVAKCGMCHKAEAKGNQLGHWEKSAHAKAFATLAGEKALAIAKEKGLKTAPQETDGCLKCHVTGHGKPAELFAESFDKTMGVQCEACHGPGGDYKSIKVMKDREAAVAAGLIMPTEAVCVTCHNEESPSFKEFDFKTAFAKIAHPNPAKAEKK